MLMADERTTDFLAKDGAVMTDEVGVITGDVTLRTAVNDQGVVTQQVQYKDAGEWYALTGAPSALTDGLTLDGLHSQTVSKLSQG